MYRLLALAGPGCGRRALPQPDRFRCVAGGPAALAAVTIGGKRLEKSRNSLRAPAPAGGWSGGRARLWLDCRCLEPADEAAFVAQLAERRILFDGGELAPVGRPDFKPGWGCWAVPGRFDSCSLPPQRLVLMPNLNVAELQRGLNAQICRTCLLCYAYGCKNKKRLRCRFGNRNECFRVSHFHAKAIVFVANFSCEYTDPHFW